MIETLTNASRVVPNSSQIHFTLGELYLDDNAPTLALPELQAAVSLSPENPEYLFNYGRALKFIGNVEEARLVLSKAFTIAPYYPGLAQLYSKILVDLGAIEDAIPPLELVINI